MWAYLKTSTNILHKYEPLELPYRKPRTNEEGKEDHRLRVGCGREEEARFLISPHHLALCEWENNLSGYGEPPRDHP